jgi:hypothetical protein
MEQHSEKAVTWRLGLALFRSSSPQRKPRLLGISKRGNSYLRQLFVHGARAVFSRSKRNRHRFGAWLNGLELRKKRSTSIVALANKLARIAWAVLTKEQTYRTALITREKVDSTIFRLTMPR